MSSQRQSWIIAVLAIVIAMLSWALVYFAKDELKLATVTPDESIRTRSALKDQQGHAALELSPAVQQASGIVTAQLRAAHSGASLDVSGMVVSLQPLIEARAQYFSSTGEASALRASISALRTDHARLRTLFEDDRNVSERAVLAAESQLQTELARLRAIEQRSAGQREAMRLAWGGTLAEWAVNPQSKAFDGLISGKELLLQFSLPHGVSDTAQLSIFLPSARHISTRRVSAAPGSDSLLPGATFFYLAPAQDLRVGMRVVARMKKGNGSREGFLVPSAAVVWHAGKAWVYTKAEDEDDLFVRREISTAEEDGDAYFNVVDWGDDQEVVVSGAQLLLSEEFKFQIRNENED